MTEQRQEFRLSDRYTVLEGSVYLSGLQALVRLPLDIARRDRRAGRQIAGYISGYEGSPLAGYDLELARHEALLSEQGIVVAPAVNEEIAVNGVAGSQLASASPRRTTDGVTGYWYGKAPGVDRASDAFRHANLGGADADGGVLALVGDDSMAKSSTVPSNSQIALAELGMPVLAPSDPQDILDLGIHGIEMSRFSGLWVALRVDTNVADGSATARVAPDRILPVHPDNTVDGYPFVHKVSSHFLQPQLGELEKSLVNERLALARRYAVSNRLNRLMGATGAAQVGIIASGATYLDVRQALISLGLTEERLAEKGVRLLKLGMVSPLVREEIRSFARGLSEIIVVEEKRSFVEMAVKEILFGQPQAPRVSGKFTPDDQPLLRPHADLTPDIIASALRTRLAPLVDLAAPATISPAPATSVRASLPLLSRTPYFCSGCPHNSSTRTPEGSLVGAGIGCSGMVMLMPSDRVGEVIGITQMGGEGAAWAGMAPFLTDKHIFQNMGDGTYHHSGSLAVRAAVASSTNVTFKILYNSTVAMTGGQNAIGGMSVPNLVRQLQAEGVARVVITTEDIGRYRNVSLPQDVEVRHRDRLIETQEELARIPGVTVLVNDQECATELRRKRKRKLVAEPPRRIFINQRVCEGCGDCGDKSNCLSVQPVMTEYGRKTQVHQASCNKDYSCLRGDCPSFLTVVPAVGTGSRVQDPVESLEATALPAPSCVVDAVDFGMRLTGIGGTGVVTTAQVVATAAVLSGRFVQSLDQTGLAQKGGAVVSDVKIMTSAIPQSNKIGAGQADLYLGCDLLVAASDTYLGVASTDRTIAIVSTAEVPTGSMVTNAAVSFPDSEQTVAKIRAVTRSDVSTYVDARQLTLDLLGDDQYANIFLVGIGCQTGALPLDPADIEAAIRINDVAVDANIQAFRRGRQLVTDPDGVHAAIASRHTTAVHTPINPRIEDIAELVAAPADSDLGILVRRRVSDLVAYQNRAYATSYAELIERLRAAEEAAQAGSTVLTLAAAQYLHKIMAYKDEYEVARLSIDPALRDAMRAEFGDGFRASFKLHPPILRALGVKGKISLGAWFMPIFMLLYRMRWLRQTPLDIFGWARVRRVERQLVREYRALLEELAATVTADNLGFAVEIAELPDVIRGYEDIKLGNVERYYTQLAELQAAVARSSGPRPAAA